MDKRIAFLKKQILSNLQHQFTIEKMARSVNLSEPHLLWLFKREVEMSPIQYLKHLRLEKARELLEDSFKNIKEIGSAVGMREQSHFVRDFKAKYGASPSEYRKQHWAKIEAVETNCNKS